MATIDELLAEQVEKRKDKKWGAGKRSSTEAMLRSEKEHVPQAMATLANEATFGLSKKINAMKKAEEDLADKSKGLHTGMQGVGMIVSAPVGGVAVKIAGKAGKIGKAVKATEQLLNKGGVFAKGAKKGAVWGATTGAGQAVGEGRNEDILSDTLAGAGAGALLGGSAGKIADVAGRQFNRKAVKYGKFLNEVKKDMSKEQLAQFIEKLPSKGKSIVDSADSQLLQRVKNIAEKDNSALDLAKRAKAKVLGGHASELEDLVEKHIDPGTSLKKHLEGIHEATSRETQPIYNKLHQTKIELQGEHKDNPVLKRYLRKASNQLGAKDSSEFRVLDQAKKLMQGDAYSVGRNPAEKTVLKDLERKVRDEVASRHPEYAEALAKERHNIKVRQAGDYGVKYTKQTPTEISETTISMSPDEKKAMRLGVKENLKDRIATKKGHSANVADIFDASEARRLANLLDGGAGKNLMSGAQGVAKKVRNFKEIGGGNPLVESEKMSNVAQKAVRWKKNLFRGAGKAIDKGIDALNPKLSSKKQMKLALSGRGLHRINKIMDKKNPKLILSGVGSPASIANAILNFGRKN
jgi:hypothetical protein